MTKAGRDLSLALGCVIFDTALLSGALVTAREEAGKPKKRGTPSYDRRAMASEVLLIKGRALLEFLCEDEKKTGRRTNDIRISDFGLPPVPLRDDLQEVRKFVGKRSAHLTWERAKEDLRDGSIPPLHATAHWILDKAHEFIENQLGSGVVLTQNRHRLDLQRLRTNYRRVQPMVESPPPPSN